MTTDGAVVVQVDDLCVRRGDAEVLPGLSFSLSPGVTGLLGPSGCGKSTLMRAMVGVQQVTSGAVSIFGQPAGSAGLRDRVGYVTQEASIYNDLSVSENLKFFAKVLGTESSSVEKALELVDLGGQRDQVAGKLSGGQRSRVSLAVALLNEPDLLVLDEPTVGLDPVLRQDLWGLFHRLAAGGACVLVSSHVMDEAERCERLLLMRSGVLIADGTPAAIKEQTGAVDIEGAFLRLVSTNSTDEDRSSGGAS